MAILGLLLLLAAAGLAVDVVMQNTSSISVDAVGQAFSLSSGWLFVAGVATGAIGLLGLTMLVGGLTRARRRRATRVDTRSSVEGLQAERDRLAEELQRERAGGRNDREIDLDDDRHSGADRDRHARTDSDRREPVASCGRHGLFSRRR